MVNRGKRVYSRMQSTVLATFLIFGAITYVCCLWKVVGGGLPTVLHYSVSTHHFQSLVPDLWSPSRDEDICCSSSWSVHFLSCLYLFSSIFQDIGYFWDHSWDQLIMGSFTASGSTDTFDTLQIDIVHFQICIPRALALFQQFSKQLYLNLN
jgi:hypothetical protein